MKIKKIFPVLLLMIVLMLVVIPMTVVLAQTETPPVTLPPLTAISLGGIVATIFSLLFDYAPGLAAKYDTWTVAQKRLTALIVAILIVAGMFTLTCYKLVSMNMICSTAGAWDTVSNIIYVFVIGQGVHAGTKPTPIFKAEVLNISPKLRGK